MKKRIAVILAVMMMVGSAGVFGAQLDIRESDLVLTDIVEVSYEVMPTQAVVSFLGDNGINVFGSDQDVTKAIDGLRSVDFDTDDGYSFNDSWSTEKDHLNYLVNSALFSAQREGYDAVYMEIGNTRWMLYPSADDE